MYWRKTAAWYWKACMMLILALAVTACGESPPNIPSNTPTIGSTNTPVVIVVEVTSTPQPVIGTSTLNPEPPTPTVDALAYQGIVQHYLSLSGAQRREYEESLKGKNVSNWNGWVDVSRKQITTGEWEVKIDLDSPDPNDSSWDVRIIVPEAQASQFSRGQAVSFSGTITEVSCGSTDCDVDIQNATFTSSMTSPTQATIEVPPTSTLPPTVVADTPAPTAPPLPTDTPAPTAPPLPIDTPAPTPPPPPTDIPAPTLPPLPTETPVPPPPTDTPLGPEAAIEAGIRKYARSTELRSVEYKGTSVNIVFKVGERAFLKQAAQVEVTDILRGAVEGAPLGYTQVWILGRFPLKDAYGNVEEGQVLNLRYDRPTIEQIDWEGFLWKNIYKIADKAIVHPDLQP